MEKLKDCSHTVIPSDCVLPAEAVVFGCAAACSHGLPWASTAKELIHQAGDSKTPSLSVQFSAIFSSPRIHHHFIGAGTRFAVGMNSWGWSSGIWRLFLAAAWVCAASEWLHNQPLVYFCTDQPVGLFSYGVCIFQSLFSLSAFIDLMLFQPKHFWMRLPWCSLLSGGMLCLKR